MIRKYRHIKNWNGIEGLAARGTVPDLNQDVFGYMLFHMGMDAYAAGEPYSSNSLAKQPHSPDWCNGWLAAQRAQEMLS